MSEPFLSEIRIMAFNYAPKGWAMCNGQFLLINQNQALFSLMGTTYGGDGRVNFALPDLRGRVSVGVGNGVSLGDRAGESAHTLTIPEMAAHIHLLKADASTAGSANTNTPAPDNSKVLGQSAGSGGTPPAPFGVNMYSTAGPTAALAPASVTPNGGSQPHENKQPFLTLNFCIALQGIFPSQN
jgi:microcystin-dependent protein